MNEIKDKVVRVRRNTPSSKH